MTTPSQPGRQPNWELIRQERWEGIYHLLCDGDFVAALPLDRVRRDDLLARLTKRGSL